MKYTNNLLLISLILMSTILTAGDGDKRNKKRSSSLNYPANSYVKRVILPEELSKFRSSKSINLPSPLNTTPIPFATASGSKFNFPTTSIYDYGWNSGIRDLVDVSDNGNVHLTTHIRTDAGVNDRRVVYWYNPGEPGELFVQATLADGKGWSNIQALADGRATIVYHVDDNGFIVDLLEGFGLFVVKSQPVTGALWMHHQIGSDDVIWYATNRWTSSPDNLTRVWSSTDEGNTWTEVTTIDKSFTHDGGPPEPVVRESMDNSEILVKNEWCCGSNVTLDSADITTYSWTGDGGSTWNEVIVTFDPYQTSPTDTTLVADVFMSDVATSDTLTVENFGQTDITYDYLGNVHMIMSGYSWHWNATAGKTQFAWPQLHYSSARGELGANFVEVSDPAVSHSEIIEAYL
ncbi:hypothetical protein E3V36_07785 [Candidatus Marinimicrobia bacterium MT.SAG.2]|nr:hypothetical protein E3V36_07785 [Candidatus Marinimicrobia bacterium MT.SAG.2]